MAFHDYLSCHMKECQSALRGLHDNSLCHSDFCDTNLLIRADGKLCIINYGGLAKWGRSINGASHFTESRQFFFYNRILTIVKR